MSPGRRNLIELTIVFTGIFAVLLWNDMHTVPLAKTRETTFFPESAAQEPVTILFAGDVMLGRHVGKLIDVYGTLYPFEKIAPDIRALAPDFFVANLEGPITTLAAPDERVSPEQPFPMRFHFNPAVVEALVSAGFTHLSLANNHALDQGNAGARDTVANLTAVGITPIGMYLPAEASAQAGDGSALGAVSRAHTNGRDIALVALDTTVTWHDRGKLAQELAAFPEDTFVVAFLHWGNEYETTHSPAQESFAHLLVDNGVDLVVGAHPHVVQDIETYGDKRIYYSLGNFVFDQYWNDDVQTGLMVLVTLDGNGVSYQELSIKSIRSQPFLIKSP